ncbi:MAG: ATP-binding cassette domain-containing protein, partial [Chloroflexi bacterium]|nr:ATP-binding cassette domain-containing protein [Chloroflexota bacterium]
MTEPTNHRAKFSIRKLTFAFGPKVALREINLEIPPNQVTVVFGPSQAGKSVLLRTLNRLNDLVEGTAMQGEVLLDGHSIYAPDVDVVALRRRIGIVFALPIPLPGTIRENMRYGLKLAGVRDQGRLEEATERGLQAAALWDEVKDRLDSSAFALSGGQQQRLCLARAL